MIFIFILYHEEANTDVVFQVFLMTFLLPFVSCYKYKLTTILGWESNKGCDLESIFNRVKLQFTEILQAGRELKLFIFNFKCSCLVNLYRVFAKLNEFLLSLGQVQAIFGKFRISSKLNQVFRDWVPVFLFYEFKLGKNTE